MALTTYAELKASIADWLNRDDLTAAIPDFISLAEAEFQRDIRHRYMITRSQATIDSRFSATPADWMQSVQLILETDPVEPLEYVTNEYINKLRASSSATGKPRYYTHVGTEIEVFPAPDNTSTGYTAELVYYAKVPVLSDSNTSNWLLSLSPDIYLYGALLQSAPYLRDDERIGVWASIYQKKVEDMHVSDQRTRGQTSVTMRTRALQ